MSAEIFALSSAICFAIANIASRFALSRHASAFSSIVAVGFGTIVLSIILFFRGFQIPSNEAIQLFGLRGILDPGISSFLLYLAFKKIGVVFTVPIIAASVMMSTSLSVFFLGEKLTIYVIVGTSLIISGVATLSFKHITNRIHIKYVIYAIIGSLLIGVSSFITKLGLNYSNDSLSGVTVSFLLGFVVQAIIITLLGKWNELPTKLHTAKLFMLAGTMGSLAFLLSFLALSQGNVSIVMPLVAVQPLFALFLSRIMLKNHETITKHVVFGTILIVSGAFILTLF